MTVGPTMDAPDFGALLRRWRVAAGLTQEGLAERAGLSARGISDLERGVKRGPHRETIRRLADALVLGEEDRAAFANAGRRRPRVVGARLVGYPWPAQPPAPLAPMIGREREAAAICDLLRRADVRLVTLVGPGGVGKTRLALRVAPDLAPEFADGVAFVVLAPVGDPGLALGAIAQALGVRGLGSRSLVELVTDHLREREQLLVLDNFEHLLAAAPAVAALIGACPRLKVLVTSRAGLRVTGEQIFPVLPLSLPDWSGAPGRSFPPELAGCEAVRLFAARARAVQPDFDLGGGTVATVAAICRRLDALPLAIELAAARVNLLPPPAMLARLDRRLPLLTGGARDLPPRLHTMRGAIAWSYDLLAPGEQALFRRLAVFAGGCTLDAAEAIGGARAAGAGRHDRDGALAPGAAPLPWSAPAVLDGLAVLLDHCLLQRTAAGDGTPRFGMLETVREYGLEMLAATGEEQCARRVHATVFLALAEAAEPALRGAEQGIWLTRLEAEHDNLRAALDWTLDGNEPAIGLRLAAALWRFWYVRGHFREGRGWLGRALSGPEPTGWEAALTRIRARALHGAGVLAHAQDDRARAVPPLEESLALCRRLGDRQGAAQSLHTLGNVAALWGEYARAEALYAESLALARAVGDEHGTADALENLGLAAREQGDLARAVALFEESLAICQRLGDEQGIADVLANLGIAARDRGDVARAGALLEAGLARYRALGDTQGLADGLRSLGSVAEARGDWALALACLAESLPLCRALGDRQQVAYCLEGFAEVAAAGERAEWAARLTAAAATVRETSGVPLPPVEAARQARLVAAVRERLGAATFAAAWAAGRVLPLEQAIVEALALASEGGAGPTGNRDAESVGSRYDAMAPFGV